MPASRIATMRSEVPTGRRMKMREGFMRCEAVVAGCSQRPRGSAAVRAARLRMPPATLAPLTGRGGAGVGACTRCAGDSRARRATLTGQHLGVILELVGTVDDHQVAGLEARGDRNVVGIAGTRS